MSRSVKYKIEIWGFMFKDSHLGTKRNVTRHIAVEPYYKIIDGIPIFDSWEVFKAIYMSINDE